VGDVLAMVWRGRWRRGQRLGRRGLLVHAREGVVVVVVGSGVLDRAGVILVVIPEARGGSAAAGQVVVAGVLIKVVVARVRGAAVVRVVEVRVRVHGNCRQTKRLGEEASRGSARTG
jgi:hypothetical protein